jgi:type I pantothenate kinase
MMTNVTTVLPPEMASVATVVRDRRGERAPADASHDGAFLVTIDGAVAVGKSTTAALLAELLELPPDVLAVRIVSTDGFLLPNRVLDARGLSMRKGFPESYDHDALEAFVRAVQAGDAELRVPMYSHETYDVLDEHEVFAPPRVLVLEGLHTTRLAGTGAVDLTIYVDADADDIERWYVERFLELTESPEGFYTAFAGWDGDSLEEFARGVWATINGPNLVEHILPNRERVDVVVTKGPDHAVTAVTLRD